MNTANLLETLDGLRKHKPNFKTERGAPSNGNRAERGQRMLETYEGTRAEFCPLDDDSTYSDAISDILHRAHAEGLDVVQIVGFAIINFREEANQVPS